MKQAQQDDFAIAGQAAFILALVAMLVIGFYVTRDDKPDEKRSRRTPTVQQKVEPIPQKDEIE